MCSSARGCSAGKRGSTVTEVCGQQLWFAEEVAEHAVLRQAALQPLALLSDGSSAAYRE